MNRLSNKQVFNFSFNFFFKKNKWRSENHLKLGIKKNIILSFILFYFFPFPYLMTDCAVVMPIFTVTCSWDPLNVINNWINLTY